ARARSMVAAMVSPCAAVATGFSAGCFLVVVPLVSPFFVVFFMVVLLSGTRPSWSRGIRRSRGLPGPDAPAARLPLLAVPPELFQPLGRRRVAARAVHPADDQVVDEGADGRRSIGAVPPLDRAALALDLGGDRLGLAAVGRAEHQPEALPLLVAGRRH